MSEQIELETGRHYRLNHSRFGVATVKVMWADSTWAGCEIMKGTLRGMGRTATWGPGDSKTVRIDQAVWTPVEGGAE